MTRKKAESGPSNAGSPAGPNSYPELDRLARLNAQLLPPMPGMLEADRHSYPCPPLGARMSHDALPATFWSLDTPAGPLLIAPCVHPESNAERPDVPLGGLLCPQHARTIYYCEDRSTLWCDGGPPDYAFHELDLA